MTLMPTPPSAAVSSVAPSTARDGAHRQVIVRLALTLLAGAFALLAATGWLLWTMMADQRASEAERAAETMAEHAEKLVGGNLALLDQVEWFVTESRAADPETDVTLHRRFKEIDEARPEVQSVWLFRPDGSVAVTSISYPPPDRNFADRDFIRAIVAGDDVFVGELILGRVTQEYSFNLSRPLKGTDGELEGILVVSLFPSAFSQFYASLARPGDVALLYRDAGDILAVHPWPETDPLGLHVPADLSPGDEPMAPDDRELTLDGDAFHYATRHGGDLPLSVAYGYSRNTLQAEWLSVVARYGLFAIPATGFLLLLGFFGLRKAEALDSAQAALRDLNRGLEERIVERTAELNASVRRQELATSAAGLGIFEWDPATGASHWENRRMFDIFGRDPANGAPDVDDFVGDCIAPEDHAALRELMTKAAQGGPATVLVRHRRKGEPGERWVELTATAETPSRLVGVCADVTERVKAEERRQLLMRELDHRMKNTLAIVQSIAGQTFRKDADLGEAREAFSGRLSALAGAFGKMMRDEGRTADMAEVVSEAVRSSGAPVDRIDTRGPAITLGSNEAVAVTMAIHELCTNAAKYGALSVEGGHVHVLWRTEGDTLLLDWRETGGPATAAPTREGFGSRLIQALAEQHGGSFEREFTPDGVVCRLRLSLRKN
jgi:two-component sensor histidine kinase